MLALLLLLCGCQQHATPIGAAHAANPEAANGPLRVQVVLPEVTTLNRITTQPVTVVPYHQANIDAKVSGYLTELNVDIGDVVEADDVLAVLDVPEMLDELTQQQAVIARLHAEEKQATAAVTLAEANVKAAQAALAQAKSEIQQANADLKAQQAEFRRIEELVGRRSVEARMEDEARQRLESAQAAKASAQASVTSSQASIAVAEAQLEAAKAEVDRAKAETAVAERQMEKMQTLMNYASLRAPFDGVVTARTVDLGDLVSNSQTSNGHRLALFTISQLDRVRVQVAIPEDDSPWATVGDVATVRLSALRGQAIEGTISRITKSLDASTRTMLAEIDIDNPEARLLPGMYGEATIVLDEQAEALVLPASAVRFDAEGKPHVYTVNESGTATVVDVTTGVDDGHQIEITSGLSAEATVIDGMLDRLADGQKVQVDK